MNLLSRLGGVKSSGLYGSYEKAASASAFCSAVTSLQRCAQGCSCRPNTALPGSCPRLVPHQASLMPHSLRSFGSRSLPGLIGLKECVSSCSHIPCTHTHTRQVTLRAAPLQQVQFSSNAIGYIQFFSNAIVAKCWLFPHVLT